MMRLARVARAALIAAALALPLAAGAEEPATASWSYDLSNSLMSPYCPGRTLIDCTSPQAAELREWIAEQEKAGVSREQVERTLYLEFGDAILQAPKPTGFGLAAYVIPAVALLAGGALVFVFLRRQAAARAPSVATKAALADPEIDRLIDEEMKRG